MPRLVRRAPLLSRIQSSFEELDTTISEFFSSGEWEEAQKEWATPIGLALNFLYLLARANSATESRGSSDVFGDGRSNFISWLSSFLVFVLSALSTVNAIYAFARKKHYRLFEAPVDVAPATPSARRVHVNSEPPTSSPLRFLTNILASERAESRAHPDSERHVWELAVWDPIPICLRLFSLFSPGHVVVYCLFLPIAPMDPRPSVTVATAIFLNALISVMLVFSQRSFSQQMKDQAIISKEVLHEYDTKFVHPTLHPLVRDVGTQTLSKQSPGIREVDTYRPTTIINRGFHPNPNPAYAAQLAEDTQFNAASQPDLPLQPARRRQSGFVVNANASITPPTSYTSAMTDSAAGPDLSSPIRAPVQLPRPQQHQRQTSPPRGDGGSLGVYTHAASPLRKTASANYLRAGPGGADEGIRRREGSPLKRMSTPGDWRGGPGRLGGRPSGGKWNDGGRRESSGYF